jgi:2-oxoglutarate ferredoxin oxidoreductase subunit beta
MLSRMENPDFPLTFGVLRDVTRPTYDGMLDIQVAQATERLGVGQLGKLYRSSDLWEVK